MFLYADLTECDHLNYLMYVCVLVRYFLRLAEEFEVNMQIYRQQILEMEHHLASADQSAALSPQGQCWSLSLVFRSPYCMQVLTSKLT